MQLIKIFKFLLLCSALLQIFFASSFHVFADNEAYISDFKVSNISITTFLKAELSKEEVQKVEKLLTDYVNSVENSLLSWEKNSKKDILTLKQSLYIDILPYIKIETISQFKSAVESEAKSYELTGNIGYVGSNPAVIWENKVMELKTQAEKNTALLREQMQSKILSEIQKRVEIIVNQEKFQSLPNSAKRELFQKFSDRLAVQIQTLQQTPSPTWVIEEKIFLYHGILELLQKYISNWSE